MAKQARFWCQIDWLAWCRGDGENRDDAVLTSSDQGFGVDEYCTGDLAYVQVLEKPGELRMEFLLAM
jgi:hypothetical protein